MRNNQETNWEPFETIENTYSAADDISLILGSDDSGWCVQDFKNNRVSKFYATKEEIFKACAENSLTWQ